jgi:hypothetical protein
MHIVADQTARYALTTSTVQEGDTVKQTDTGVMYLVVDSTKLDSADGYTEYSAGTASKAIADEDGNNIKSSYGKLAGANTWTEYNTFTSYIALQESAVIPAGGYGKGIAFRDYQNNRLGYIQPHLTSNSEKRILIGADSGDIASNSNIIPNANNAVNLGSSSYQWSSVYAQTYYYNGVAWGLDKANTWTGANTFSAGVLTTLVETSPGNTELVIRSTDQTWESGARIFLYSNTQTGQTNGSIYIDVDHGDNGNTKTGLTLVPNAFHPIGGTVNTTYGVSLGTATYQWAKVYSEQYYYNGTAWGLDKVNEWSNTNYFNKTLFCDFSNLANKAIPNSYIQDPLIIVEGNTSPKTWHGGIALERYTNGDEGFQLLTCSYVNGTTQQLGALRYLVSGDGTESYCYSRGPTKQHLGTSTNKWTTLNGVNPGALSLPDYNSTAKVDISGSIIPDQYGNISYTPPINGWLYVCFNISNATTTDSIFYIQAKDNNVANSSFVQTSWMPTSGTGTSSLAIFFPVVANKRFVMQINFSNYTIIKAHVIPCLGNV